MIRYLFTENIPDEANLATFLKKTEQSKIKSTPLQIIEIATNEGTTKSPIEATMIELIQNRLMLFVNLILAIKILTLMSLMLRENPNKSF